MSNKTAVRHHVLVRKFRKLRDRERQCRERARWPRVYGNTMVLKSGIAVSLRGV
jgi:hypothetical protein